MDDNDFGSSVQGNGQNNGGELMYAALSIEFPPSSTEHEVIPAVGFLAQNYPNPFNPSTTISFSLNTENTEDTEIIIYNIKGQKVKTFTILQSEIQNPNCVVWDGTNDNNEKVSSGVYFYRMTAGDYASTKKMILIK